MTNSQHIMWKVGYKLIHTQHTHTHNNILYDSNFENI